MARRKTGRIVDASISLMILERRSVSILFVIGDLLTDSYWQVLQTIRNWRHGRD